MKRGRRGGIRVASRGGVIEAPTKRRGYRARQTPADGQTAPEEPDSNERDGEIRSHQRALHTSLRPTWMRSTSRRGPKPIARSPRPMLIHRRPVQQRAKCTISPPPIRLRARRQMPCRGRCSLRTWRCARTPPDPPSSLVRVRHGSRRIDAGSARCWRERRERVRLGPRFLRQWSRATRTVAGRSHRQRSRQPPRPVLRQHVELRVSGQPRPPMPDERLPEPMMLELLIPVAAEADRGVLHACILWDADASSLSPMLRTPFSYLVAGGAVPGRRSTAQSPAVASSGPSWHRSFS